MNGKCLLAPLLAAASWLLSSAPSLAAFNAAPFLHETWSPQAVALGGAAAAQANGSFALMGNPSGVALGHGGVALSRTPVAGSAAYTFLGVDQPIGRVTLAAGMLWFGTTAIPQTDASGRVIGSFDYRQSAALVGIGQTHAAYSWGAVLKRVDIHTVGTGGGGFGVDAGVGWKTLWGRWALVGQDLTGTRITWEDGHADEVGTRIAAGFDVTALPGWDLNAGVDSTGAVHIGAERPLLPSWIVRGGVEVGGGASALTLGTALTTPTADVAYGVRIPLNGGYLGARQTLGLRIRI